MYAIMEKRLERDIKKYEEETREFAAGFLLDPAYALEWSNDIFKTAARLHVATVVLAWIVKGETNIRERADELVFRGARFPQASTSQSSNIMHTQVISAWATFVEEYLND